MDVDAVGSDCLCDRVVEEVEFLKGSATKSVDEEDDVFACFQAEVFFKVCEDTSCKVVCKSAC